MVTFKLYQNQLFICNRPYSRNQELHSLVLIYRALNKAFNSYIIFLYRIAQNCGGGKLWRIDRFKALGEENVGEFTVANSSYF